MPIHSITRTGHELSLIFSHFEVGLLDMKNYKEKEEYLLISNTLDHHPYGFCPPREHARPVRNVSFAKLVSLNFLFFFFWFTGMENRIIWKG